MNSAVAALAHSITHARFEATDTSSDEAVLMKILLLFELLLTSELGQKNLDDKALCEMIEAGFGMSFQGRTTGLYLHLNKNNDI